MNIIEQLEHKRHDRKEIASELGSINPKLSYADKLKGKLAAVDRDIAALEEKRLHIKPVEASYGIELMSDTSKIAAVPIKNLTA